MAPLYETTAWMMQEDGTPRMVSVIFTRGEYFGEEDSFDLHAYRKHCRSCIHKELCDKFEEREGVRGSWVSDDDSVTDCDFCGFYQERDGGG